MKARALGHALLLLALGGHGPAQADRAKPLDAELSALRLSGPARMEELSGLAVSRTYPGIVWGHGDSGQPPVLWALDLERGELAFPPYLAKKFDDGASWPGLTLEGASNIDWEDLTTLNGWLYLGEFGNNGNARRDLGLWALPEPNPRATERQRPPSFYPFTIPNSSAFPPKPGCSTPRRSLPTPSAMLSTSSPSIGRPGTCGALSLAPSSIASP